MKYGNKKIEVKAQLNRAKAALSIALGQTQDICTKGLDVGKISQALARAVRKIYSVQTLGIDHHTSKKNVESAMSFLRKTLALLQDITAEDEALNLATGTIAKVMAMLYPVFKALEEPEPVLLSSKNKKQKEPVELTSPVKQKKEKAIPPENKRIAQRKQIEVDIGVFSGNNFYAGFVLDISSGGLFISTYNVLSVGSKVNINFSFPRGPVMSLDGKVKWIREYNPANPDMEPGYGVQFDNLNDNDKNIINKFMKNNQPLFYEEP